MFLSMFGPTESEKDLEMAVSLLAGSLSNNPEYRERSLEWLNEGELMVTFNQLDEYALGDRSREDVLRHMKILRLAINASE